MLYFVPTNALVRFYISLIRLNQYDCKNIFYFVCDDALLVSWNNQKQSIWTCARTYVKKIIFHFRSRVWQRLKRDSTCLWQCIMKQSVVDRWTWSFSKMLWSILSRWRSSFFYYKHSFWLPKLGLWTAISHESLSQYFNYFNLVCVLKSFVK